MIILDNVSLQALQDENDALHEQLAYAKERIAELLRIDSHEISDLDESL